MTREQLRARLWDAETFVDAEAGLNTAIAKLRDALGETADAPRFIETLPKRGYRLRVPLSPVPEQATDAAPIGRSGPHIKDRRLLNRARNRLFRRAEAP